MSGLLRVVLWLAAAWVVAVGTAMAAPSAAVAQPSKGQTIHVLSIDSDDADEQADALSMALRSHIRKTPGWSLLETTQSLSMLTAAFQCPPHPDAGCLTRIGDKLKADQFLWGIMTKAPGHQVTVEVHWWSRGKADHVARESFSDNMKDSNDDGLRKVATQIFGKLLEAAAGTLVLHASADSATVLVDGESKGVLDHGRLTLTLAAGAHSLELQASGFANAHRDVTIQPSGTSQLEVVMEPEGGLLPIDPTSKPLPIRKIVEWSAIAAGGILIATGVGFTVAYFGDQSTLNTARMSNYNLPRTQPGNMTISDPCNPGPSTSLQSESGCSAVHSIHSAEAGEVVTFSVGGALAAVGVYLLVTDHSAAEAQAPPPAPPASSSPPRAALSTLRIVPSMERGGGSMLMLGSF